MSEDTYDVLVGSDGIWSSVRAQMYGETVKSSSTDMKSRQGCTYSGYTVFAGECVFETPDYYDTGYKVYIGPKRYFVTSDVGGGKVQWYAFFALPPGSKRAPSGWGGSTRDDQADPDEDLVAYIKGLHAGWSPEVHAVLDATNKARRKRGSWGGFWAFVEGCEREACPADRPFLQVFVFHLTFPIRTRWSSGTCTTVRPSCCGPGRRARRCSSATRCTR
jgi:hypothetical protein